MTSTRGRNTARPRVLIFGGGFTGLACANALDADEFAVTLVDRKPHFEFLPNIHELLSAVKQPDQLRLPLRDVLRQRGHRFVNGDVTRIEPAQRALQLGKRKLLGDYLVIAPGSADADYGVAGVQQNAMGFKSVNQCAAIHRRLQKLARTAGRVVIIGGGLEGVEALGEILRRYRNDKLKITLIEAHAALLPGQPGAVGDYIGRLCAEASVTLIHDDPVVRITPKTVLLRSGRRLASDATIWTGGPAPPALLADCGLAPQNAWAPVLRTLEHGEFPRVFVAGDAATLAMDQGPTISKQAYHALDMGGHVAQSVKRLAAGKKPRRFRPANKPTLLAFGDNTTVLINGDSALAGPGLAAAKEAVFSTVMTQLDRRETSDRLAALLARSSAAGRELLWPRLGSLRTLVRQAQLRRLS